MTSPEEQRAPAAAKVRRVLRDTFGLWPMHEAKNKVLMGRRVPALRRFENAEVERLRPLMGALPAAKVATVIPTYRRPLLLTAAVESALAQTVTDQVVVVVDDGTGDLPTLPDDPRLRAVSLSRNSKVAGVVRNVGIRTTRSEYIAFLDDDNTWRPDHLALAIAALETGPDVVYTAVERRRDGELVDVLSEPFRPDTFRDGPPYVDTNAIVVRRAPDVLFSRIPRTRATMPVEDWELVNRLSRTREIRHVPEPTVRYLIHADSYYSAWNEGDAAPTS